MEHQMKLELNREGLLVLHANYYTPPERAPMNRSNRSVWKLKIINFNRNDENASIYIT